VGKSRKTAVNVPQKYFLSKELAEAAEFQEGSTICGVYWNGS